MGLFDGTVKKGVEKARVALVQAFKAKSMSIAQAHANVDPSKIPWIDVARATILNDIADIIQNLDVQDDDDKGKA